MSPSRLASVPAISGAEKKLAELKALVVDVLTVKMHVTQELIGEVVSRLTGIAVARLSQNQRTRFLHLADELHKWVIVHDEVVAEAVMRSLLGWEAAGCRWGASSSSRRTETESATAITEQFFVDENSIARADTASTWRHAQSRGQTRRPGTSGTMMVAS